MAAQWILGKTAISAAGGFIGGACKSAGNGVNGVGQSINGQFKKYGDGIIDYGNGVMDWANAPGRRGQTASNPLGQSGGRVTGKDAVTNPKVYSAPKQSPQRSTSKTETAKPASKAPAAPKPLPAPKAAPKTAPKAATKTAATSNGARSGAVKPSTGVRSTAATPLRYPKLFIEIAVATKTKLSAKPTS
ncbi:hypothetical protein GQ53DRAFT_802262 [Thozetella sp. PMI_491]|nr:hypothetical protein GQ53DRAFT_802262 [Thozetella sp. PMI_491]